MAAPRVNYAPAPASASSAAFTLPCAADMSAQTVEIIRAAYANPEDEAAVTVYEVYRKSREIKLPALENQK